MLQDVQTLILDGLSVTSELVHDIICREDSNVRILSIREVRHLNGRKLQQALQYAVRASRPADTPKLEALYIFGLKDDPLITVGLERGGNRNHEGCIKWGRPPSHEWASTIMACKGIISYDAVLCHGPRHFLPATSDGALPWYKQQSVYIPPRIASFCLGVCCKCNSAPEGFTTFGISSMDQFPLLYPPPFHSFTAKSAKGVSSPKDKSHLFRCLDCMQDRRCDCCEKWWCEDCYGLPNASFSSAKEVVSEALELAMIDEVKVNLNLCAEISPPKPFTQKG